MPVKVYQLNSFVSDKFQGNPAGVCLLDAMLEPEVMQWIAAEMAVSDTAFLAPREDGSWDIRWFTPEVEVPLCGHATLAAAWVLDEIVGAAAPYRLHSPSGDLQVSMSDSGIELDFPAQASESMAVPEGLASALGCEQIVECRQAATNGGYWLVALPDKASVLGLEPDLKALGGFEASGIIATAQGETCDFVSRFFAPKLGIDEDPVTGSAHCMLVPYWAERLGKTELLAHQRSTRGGELLCRLQGDRVLLAGRANLGAVRQISASLTAEDIREMLAEQGDK